MCYRTIKTPEGNIIKAVDSSAAVIGRDTLAKTVYARLFDWYGHVPSWTAFIIFQGGAHSVATAGLLTTLISPLGRTWSPGHRLGSWTSMVLSVSNITGQTFGLSFKLISRGLLFPCQTILAFCRWLFFKELHNFNNIT